MQNHIPGSFLAHLHLHGYHGKREVREISHSDECSSSVNVVGFVSLTIWLYILVN
jgi:hypothetical protein